MPEIAERPTTEVNTPKSGESKSRHACLVDTCCCCISVNTGCWVIAGLQLVGLVIVMINSLRLLVVGQDMSELRGVMNSDQLERSMFVGSVYNLVMCLITLPFNIIFILGLHQYRRGAVKIYIIYSCLAIVVDSLSIIVRAATDTAPMWSIPLGVVAIIITVYFIFVFRTQYINMGKQ